jgi:pSer/pThr/pTyr-binding forkhead associated (FHA) protein
MKLSLVVLSQGKLEGKAIPITLSQFLIGRDPQCHLRPASPLISKRHCAVLVKGGKVFLRDFGSTNGTFVNDEPVKAERQLNNDDLLKVGPLLFRVHVELPAAVDKPTPLPPQAQQPAETAGDDDSIAAMLLSLQDEGGAGPAGGQVKEEDIPSGTTVMDIPTMPPDKQDEAGAATAKEGTADSAGKKDAAAKAKASVGSSSSAAAALLAKYARRPRTP